MSVTKVFLLISVIMRNVVTSTVQTWDIASVSVTLVRSATVDTSGHVKIVSDSTDEHPFYVGMDILLTPPYPKQYSEEEHREATINLFGQLLEPN